MIFCLHVSGIYLIGGKKRKVTEFLVNDYILPMSKLTNPCPTSIFPNDTKLTGENSLSEFFL